jgi:HK97 family phage portal protein
MSYWSKMFSRGAVTPNDNGPSNYQPGDPDGFEIVGNPIERRSLPTIVPSPWDGYPADWDMPPWQINAALDKLVDIAWACLDMNSNIISAMPVYRMRTSPRQIMDPAQWMMNPDPTIYSSWQEFAKQLFWDFQMGEAFVLPMATSYGKPTRFRVIPPYMMKVDMRDGVREYKLGSLDVTDDVLHLRYQSTVADARGHGPLEVAGARQTQIKLLQRYANTLAETGGVPLYWIGVNRRLSGTEGSDLIQQWVDSRSANPAAPGVLGSGATLNQAKTMSAKEMALLEVSQFSESRIAILLGVPPFLMGLAGASGSLTYSNISDLFDFHDRSSLRPKSKMVMEALSDWALVRGQSAELNRDDYTRLPLDKRMQAYKTAIEMEILTPDEVRIMERYYGEPAAQALTGGSD